MKYLFLLLMPFKVVAFCGDTSETWARVGLWSHHHGKHATKKQNETHYQLGVDIGNCTALTYINSKEQRGYIVARRSMWDLYQNDNLKWDAGIMYGGAYFEANNFHGKQYDSKVMAAFLFGSTLEINNAFSIDFYTIPTVVSAVGFRVRF